MGRSGGASIDASGSLRHFWQPGADLQKFLSREGRRRLTRRRKKKGGENGTIMERLGVRQEIPQRDGRASRARVDAGKEERHLGIKKVSRRRAFTVNGILRWNWTVEQKKSDRRSFCLVVGAGASTSVRNSDVGAQVKEGSSRMRRGKSLL